MVSPDANAIPKESARPARNSQTHILVGLAVAALALISIAVLGNMTVRTSVGKVEHALLALSALVLLLTAIAGLSLLWRKHQGSEAALREEEERYRDLFENAHDLIQIVQPDGFLLEVNRAWMETLGYSERDVNAGLYTWDVLEPSSIPHCRQLVERMNAGEDVGRFEFQFRTKNGRVIDVEGTSDHRFARGQQIGRCGVFRDITERKQAQKQAARLQAIVEAAPRLIAMADATGQVIYGNRAYRRFAYGIAAESMTGLEAAATHPAEIAQELREKVLPVVMRDGLWKAETVLVNCQGNEVPVEQIVLGHLDDHGELEFLSTIAEDLGERKRAAEELLAVQKQLRDLLGHEQQISRIDALTQIPNRRAFYELAEAERRRASRNGQPVSLAYLDVDDFKKVNDTLGHKTGDQLLECVARTLRTKLRVSDIVARIGGDEFAIFLPETSSREAEVVLRKLQSALQEAMRIHRWSVGFSIGAVAFVGVPNSLDSMVSFADAVMYSVKRSGKNNVSITLMGIAAGPMRSAVAAAGSAAQVEEPAAPS